MGMLEGRSAILVGASSGVGYGCALKFAEEGADMIAAARRVDRLEGLAVEASERGFRGRIIPVACDAANEPDLDAVVEAAVTEFGKIDILACIAQGGMEHQTFLLDTTADDARVFYETGPLYTMRLIQKVVPHMKERGYGRIITTASGAAVMPAIGYKAYAMAKGAIMALTRIAAKELGGYGIVTNRFLPVIKNELFGQDPQSAAALEIVKKTIPVGYIGEAYEDAGPVVTFMASEGAHYMNGQFIGVCGGLQILA